VARAWAAGALVVAAAGNGATDVPYYPGASPHALAIAASGRDDGTVSFSNRGSWVSLAAPGVGIFSTYPTYMAAWHIQPGYQFKDGTSMSTPHVSGVAALLVSLHPDYSADGIAGLLFVSADKIESCPVGVSACPYDAQGRNDYFGHGRLNAAR